MDTHLSQTLGGLGPCCSDPVLSRGKAQSLTVSPEMVDSADDEAPRGSLLATPSNSKGHSPTSPGCRSLNDTSVSVSSYCGPQPESSSSLEALNPHALVPCDRRFAMQTQIPDHHYNGDSSWQPWQQLPPSREVSQSGFGCSGPANQSWQKPWAPSREERNSGIEPTGVGAGLANLGNTCFINAVLQCFTHTVPLVQGLRSFSHENLCHSANEGFCILCALRDHIELSLRSSGGVISPSRIFDNLNHISPCFQRYQQEDAHEFLQYFLDGLETCSLDSKPQNNLSCQEDDLVKQVFGGRLISRLRCCNCGHYSDTYEPLLNISLGIEDVDTLPSAIDSFTKVEKIDDPDAKFKCENCKKEVSMDKQLLLDQVPSVATFHLKRFKSDGNWVEKIDKHVEFPLDLDLQPYISNQISNDELKYQLYAVVKHSGFSPTSGHYVCYVRSSLNTWHKLNDSRVQRVEEECVLSQEAYILFYARQDIPWFSSVIDVQNSCLDPYDSNPSPKSVLDNGESKSEAHLGGGSTGVCEASGSSYANVQFPCTTQNELDVNKTSVSAEDYRSEQTASEFNVSRDDTPMIDAPLLSRPDYFSDSLCNEDTCSASCFGEDSCCQDVDESRDYDGCPQTPIRSQGPDRCHGEPSGVAYSIPRDHLGEERRTRRKPLNKSLTGFQRIEAARYLKKTPSSRRSGLIAAMLGPQNDGKKKKRTGLSPCKRAGRCQRINCGAVMHALPVTR